MSESSTLRQLEIRNLRDIVARAKKLCETIPTPTRESDALLSRITMHEVQHGDIPEAPESSASPESL